MGTSTGRPPFDAASRSALACASDLERIRLEEAEVEDATVRALLDAGDLFGREFIDGPVGDRRALETGVDVDCRQPLLFQPIEFVEIDAEVDVGEVRTFAITRIEVADVDVSVAGGSGDRFGPRSAPTSGGQNRCGRETEREHAGGAEVPVHALSERDACRQIHRLTEVTTSHWLPSSRDGR